MEKTSWNTNILLPSSEAEMFSVVEHFSHYKNILWLP